ncbi:MAG: branched-chain amino acid aminotransferase [Oscillospiraceae bacterium]|jgi:branched-chain amino acid aminotransferase|nr:branched-chain amino acid aminotransferase [Oscillospiraceae bacterium]
MDIPVTKTKALKQKPADDILGFGQYFTDHMFLMDYGPDKGWHDPRIVPHGPLSLDPAAMCLHYGQELFEGLKAYRGADGRIRLFRYMDNIRRFNNTCERLDIPAIDEAVFREALFSLLRVEVEWAPHSADASLYIRPFLIATDPYIGVRSSKKYLFILLLSPVGAYYKGGLAPTKIYVETEDVRAVRGGLGSVKAAANYAATLRAQTRAGAKGFTQVMWLDAFERKYVDEVGTSNAFFVIGGTVVTPPIGTILPGITRDSCLRLLREWGIPAEERQISIDEVWQAQADGRLEECFATGTAAVVSPVGQLCYNGETITISGNQVGPIAQRLYDTLTGIQWGRTPDTMGWTEILA